MPGAATYRIAVGSHLTARRRSLRARRPHAGRKVFTRDNFNFLDKLLELLGQAQNERVLCTCSASRDAHWS
jgi:hypothetical protein